MDFYTQKTSADGGASVAPEGSLYSQYGVGSSGASKPAAGGESSLLINVMVKV